MTQKVSSNSIVSLNASKLTGPHSNATDGSNLTNINDGMIESASDPTTSSNPNSGLGTLWVNHTSGEMYCCTNAATNANVWTNVGAGTGDVINQPPTDPTNTGSFQTITESSSYNFTFSGATDDQSGFTYVVDNISNAVLTVSAAEVAGGSAHTFNTSSVGSDTNVTFRVRTKDSNGLYSSGVTVNTTVTNQVFTQASGGNASGPAGNYTYHTFTSPGSLSVSQIGSDPAIEYMVVAGAGGGNNNVGGAGGGGGMLVGSISGTTTTYSVSIGSGGNSSGGDGSPSSFHNITATGGGGGGSRYGVGRPGGSGGGGGGSQTGAGGSGTGGQGNRGGNASSNAQRGGGGGGKGAQGTDCASGVFPPHGGDGQLNSYDGNNYYYAGGGGGSYHHTSKSGSGGMGGAGGGGKGYHSNTAPAGANGRNPGQQGSSSGGYGGINTGSGGGGGGWQLSGGSGGSGIVIVRYLRQ